MLDSAFAAQVAAWAAAQGIDLGALDRLAAAEEAEEAAQAALWSKAAEGYRRRRPRPVGRFWCREADVSFDDSPEEQATAAWWRMTPEARGRFLAAIGRR